MTRKKTKSNDDPLGMMRALRNIQAGGDANSKNVGLMLEKFAENGQRAQAAVDRLTKPPRKRTAKRKRVDAVAEKFTMAFAGYHSVMLEWATGKCGLAEYTKARTLLLEAQRAYEIAVREFLGE